MLPDSEEPPEYEAPPEYDQIIKIGMDDEIKHGDMSRRSSAVSERRSRSRNRRKSKSFQYTVTEHSEDRSPASTTNLAAPIINENLCGTSTPIQFEQDEPLSTSGDNPILAASNLLGTVVL